MSTAPSEARPDVSGKERDATTAAGGHAWSPAAVPARGWWAALKRAVVEIGEDNIGIVAAGCAFYAMLALFPAISLLISLYGLLANPATVQQELELLRGAIPEEAYALVAGRVHDLVDTASTTLGWSLLISLAISLWSSMAATKSLMTAMNVAYEERERRSFLRFNLVSLVLTLGGVVAVIVAMTAMVALPAILTFAGLGGLTRIAIPTASVLVVFLFVLGCLAVLYRFGPSRRGAKWHWISPGSLMATMLLFVASFGFSFYVSNFASYDVMYGSLGAVVVVLLWFWISAFVVLAGAEVNAELELQTQRDTTIGPDRPMGERGAFVADHVARRSGQRRSA